MNTLEALFSEVLSGAARLALSLDPDHQSDLAALEGRSLRIHCTNPPQRLTLRVSGGELSILPGSELPTDATVTGTFADLVELVRGNRERGGPGSPGRVGGSGLQVNGDALVMRDFARFFERFSPDLSAILPTAGPFTGAPGDWLEQLRGTVEVGLTSFSKVLGGMLQSGAEQVQSATRDRFTGDNEFAAVQERTQRLRSAMRDLNKRVDALAAGKRGQ